MDELGRTGAAARPPRRRVAARAALVVLATLVAGLFAVPGPASADGGGDQAIRYGGGDVGLPSGYVRVYFANVGTDTLVGRTTVVAEAGSGTLQFTHAAFYPAGGPVGGDTLTGSGPEISPDGTRLTYQLDGTNAPGVTREMRVYFTGNRFMPPSSYRITFTHPDDANRANDTLAVGPAPPPVPA